MPIIIALFLIFISSAQAEYLPEESRVPGGLAIVPLTGIDADQAPKAYWNKRRLLVVSSKNSKFSDNSDWLALLGIPLSASSKQPLIIKTEQKSYQVAISDKKYESQYLTIKNKKMVNPDPKQVQRWRKESKEMLQAFTYWQDKPQLDLAFDWPLEGRLSSPFGLKRFFNNQPRKPHSGLDIAAATGTPIYAPASGIVRQTGHYFFNGKTILLDHGQGLVSMLCHLSEISVAVGDKISKEQLLGKIGSTGRVTGPHLHWSLSLNNQRIDPILFLPKQ